MKTGVDAIDRSRLGALAMCTLLLCGAALCLLALAARILTLTVATFDMDEFTFALVARDVLSGKLPYTGLFDDKPVGLTYVFALAEWLGNRSLASVHGVGLVSVVAAGGLIYATGRTLGLRVATSLAMAGLFGVEVLLLGGWASMSELVAAPVICAANFIIVRGRLTGLGAYALVGLLLGTVGQISYLALPGLALTGLGLLGPTTIGDSLRRACAIGAGFAAATMLIWLPQILTNVLLPYLQDQLYFYRHYRASTQSFAQFVNGFLAPALDIGLPVLAIAIWAAVGRPPTRRLSASFLPIVLQLIGTLISAGASNRYFPHYTILCLPSLAALTALLAAAGPPGRETRVNVILLYWGAITAAICARDLPQRLSNPGIEKNAARLVDQLVGPGRPIFVFNETPALYYLSRSEAIGPYPIPNLYLPSCSISVQMPLSGNYLARIMRARPDLILSGSLCPIEFDSDEFFRLSGYVRVGKVSEGDREIAAYAPASASPRAVSPFVQ